MAGKSDQVKGRVKEAAGALTGNNRLRRAVKLTRQPERRRKRSGKLWIRRKKSPRAKSRLSNLFRVSIV